MSEEIPLYDLQEESTSGWVVVDEGSNLTKEQCSRLYDHFLYLGVSPKRLKIVRVA